MKTFIDSSSGSGNENDFLISVTPSYVELEIVSEEVSFYVYVIQRTENSFFITTCWDDSFDELIAELDEDSFEIIADTWELFAYLLVNGLKDKYQEGALIQLEDADYGDTKWFVATVAGNVHLSDDIDEFFAQERVQEAVQLVVQRSMHLMKELNENSPSTGKAIWKGIKKGVGAGLAASLFGL